MAEKRTISNLRDIHKDKLCFILGAGPSLHFVDSNIFSNYVTITVNSGIMKYPQCNYFLSDDSDVVTWDYYSVLLPTLSCVKLLYRKKMENHANHLENVIFFDHTWWCSSSFDVFNPDGIILRKEEPIIGAINSVGSAVHMAYIMGCNPVVLSGCDCCYKDGHRYFWQYEGENRAKRISDNYRKIEDKYLEHEYTKKSVMYWKALAKANQNILQTEMVIIDASESILDCFPKMTIDDIVRKHGDRK